MFGCKIGQENRASGGPERHQNPRDALGRRHGLDQIGWRKMQHVKGIAYKAREAEDSVGCLARRFVGQRPTISVG